MAYLHSNCLLTVKVSLWKREATRTSNEGELCFYILHASDVQDIFATLDETGDVTDYSVAVSVLNSYFVPRSSETDARHAFKQTIPKPGESIQQYVVRLKTAVRDSGYGSNAINQIRDQILFNCESEYIQRKLLEEKGPFTLERALQIAQDCESVEQRLLVLIKCDVQTNAGDTVNKISNKPSHNATRYTKRNDNRGHAIVVGTLVILDETPLVQLKGKHAANVVVITISPQCANQRTLLKRKRM